MTLQTKVIIGLAAAVLGAIAIAATWSGYRLNKLERAAETAIATAEQKEHSAAELEQQAQTYREKIAYLEEKLGSLEPIARKQDEQLKKNTADTIRARRDADGARRTERIDTTDPELCKKLAGLGHPCE